MRAAILITGMSGTGKSAALAELARRGHSVVDTDYGDWIEDVKLPDGSVEPLWNEERIDALLTRASDGALFVVGTVANQGRFYPRFDAVVLLSAPLDVILERVASRENPFGRTEAEREKIADDLATYEPLLTGRGDGGDRHSEAARRSGRRARVDRSSDRDVAGAEGRRQRLCAALAPTSVERDGLTPCARANASSSPGSGGLHQQTGGPAGMWADCALHRPRNLARELADGVCERIGPAAGPPVEHKVRSVRGGCMLHGSCRDEHAAQLLAAASRSNATLLDAGEALVRVRRLELAERSHLRRRREQPGSSRPGAEAPRESAGAEALEQPLDEVDLRLRERRVEPDATRGDPMPRRSLDDVAARCPGQVRVVEHDVPHAGRQLLVEGGGDVRNVPPRSSRFSRT